MLTPLDIQNKEFTKGFRGYVEIEVDSFLDEVIEDFEHVFKENLELKSKIEMLNEQIGHYNTMENTLQKTLIVAQTTAEDVIKTARQQGDAIIDESDRRAEKIMDSARDQVMNSKQEYEKIRKEILMFRSKYKSLLTSQLENIDHYGEDENVFSILDEMKVNDKVERESVFQSENVAQSQVQPSETKEENPQEKEESVFASDFAAFAEQDNEYVSSFGSDENIYAESLEDQVNAFEKDIEENKNEHITSYEVEDNMYVQQYNEPPVESYQEDICNEPSVENYQGEDSYASSLQSQENTFSESTLSSDNEQQTSYQGEESYASSLQNDDNTFSQNFENQSPATYQGEEAPGNAFANKLQQQKNQESLYVENLQEEQKVNENKITPKDSEYEEEIQNIYTTMDQQSDHLSQYAKKAVLD